MSLSRFHQFFSWVCQHFSLPKFLKEKQLLQSPYTVLFVDVTASFLALPLVLFIQLGTDITTYSFLYIFKNSFCLALCSLGFFTLFQTYTYAFERFDAVHTLKQLSAIILCAMTFVPLTVLLSQEEELPGFSVLLTCIAIIGLTSLPKCVAFIMEYMTNNNPIATNAKPLAPSIPTIITVEPIHHAAHWSMSKDEIEFLSHKKILLLHGKTSFLSKFIQTLSPHLQHPLHVIHHSFESLKTLQSNNTEQYNLKTYVCDMTDHSLLESLIESIKPDILLFCSQPTWLGADNHMYYLRTHILSMEFLSFAIHKHGISQAALLLNDDHTAHHFIPMIKAAFMRFSQEGESQYLLLSHDVTLPMATTEEIVATSVMKSFFELRNRRDILEYTLFEEPHTAHQIHDRKDHFSQELLLTPHEYTAWIHTPFLELLLQAIDQCQQEETLKILQQYHINTHQSLDVPMDIEKHHCQHPLDDEQVPANDVLSTPHDTRSAS